MTEIYYNSRGGFRAEYLHVKYPDFAGGRLEASHAGRGHDRDNSLAFEVVACSSGISSANMSKCQSSDWPASNSTFAVPVDVQPGSRPVKQNPLSEELNTGLRAYEARESTRTMPLNSRPSQDSRGGHGNKCQGRWDK